MFWVRFDVCLHFKLDAGKNCWGRGWSHVLMCAPGSQRSPSGTRTPVAARPYPQIVTGCAPKFGFVIQSDTAVVLTTINFVSSYTAILL